MQTDRQTYRLKDRWAKQRDGKKQQETKKKEKE